MNIDTISAALETATYFSFSNPSELLMSLQRNSETAKFVAAGPLVDGIYPFNTLLPHRNCLVDASNITNGVINSLAHAEAVFVNLTDGVTWEALQGINYDSAAGFTHVPTSVKKKAIVKAFNSLRLGNVMLERDADFFCQNSLGLWRTKYRLFLSDLLTSYHEARTKETGLTSGFSLAASYDRAISEVETVVRSLDSLTSAELVSIRNVLLRGILVGLITDSLFRWKLNDVETAEAVSLVANLDGSDLDELLAVYQGSISARLAVVHSAMAQVVGFLSTCAEWETSDQVIEAFSGIDSRLKGKEVRLSGVVSRFTDFAFRGLELDRYLISL